MAVSRWADKDKTTRGLESLRQYRREWDDKRKTFNPRPLHDWTSHAADAFRYLAMGLRGSSLKDQFTKPLYPVGNGATWGRKKPKERVFV